MKILIENVSFFLTLQVKQLQLIISKHSCHQWQQVQLLAKEARLLHHSRKMQVLASKCQNHMISIQVCFLNNKTDNDDE